MVTRVVLDLVETLGRLPLGATATVPVTDGEADTVAAWCARTGNDLVSFGDGRAVVRRGHATRPDLPDDRRVGTRLWLYTNFDCNLACDYCCARSSPRTPRRALGAERIDRLVCEAAEAGISEVYLTGGEPFLLPDLDRIVVACTRRLPTTLLTNGMLFRGSRLQMLRRMPRQDLSLQISLDSAIAHGHDRHRGPGSWQRALDGIRTALAEGFHVRVAATVEADQATPTEQTAFHTLLGQIGIPRADQLVRPIARRGFADTGVVLTTETLIPEITVTTDGVYWHPIGADHDDQLITHNLFPLANAIAEAQRRFTEYRHHANTAAQRFPCA
jgi:uncharacterized Fe-S cluster-containing radical SAM superfamily protein